MNITIHHKNDIINTTYTVPTLLSQAIQDAGIPFSMPCGGNKTCLKCAVKTTGITSNRTPKEQLLPQNMRLACCTFALADTTIWIDTAETTIVTDGCLPIFHPTVSNYDYGIAIDIGTTTVVLYCYDLKTQNLLGRSCFQNPQTSFGADVISRIKAALEGQASVLQKTMIDALDAAAQSLLNAHNIDYNTPILFSITGNTTMLYLLTGTSVEPLSHSPFAIDEMFIKPTSIPLQFPNFPHADSYLCPTISAFVGSDITCAILSSEINLQTTSNLLLDIGTNGEMALCHNGTLLCCSTAAGPAFEGAGITYGMSALAGAIDTVTIQNDQICYTTIDEKAAIGLCGSGLIDAVACFLELGCIDETGCIDTEVAAQHHLLIEYAQDDALKIGDSNIVLTAKDIREVQLAKAAIRAGVETLLHTAAVSHQSISQVLLAGGFGRYLNVTNACAIGLIPKELLSCTKSVGNAAGMGAIMNLLSTVCQTQSATIARNATTLDLSISPVFMDNYVNQMMFE